jgi:hypothetical protein
VFETSTTYATDYSFDNEFNDDNFFANSIPYFFEATLYQGAEKGCTAGTVYAVLYNETDGVTINTSSPPSSEVSTTATLETRARSSNIASDLPTTVKNLSNRSKVSGTCSVTHTNAWLIIQISQLGVPEAIIFFLPVALFLPVVVRWWRIQKAKKLAPVFREEKNG